MTPPQLAAQSAAASGSTIAIIIVAVVFGVYRRTRPRRVDQNRLIAFTVVIALVSVLSFFSAGAPPRRDLTLALAPAFAAAGVAVGWTMARSMTFWSPAPGQLWMRGGAAYMAVFLATLILRFGIRYVATGTLVPGGPPGPAVLAREAAIPAPLAILSADLLFFSAGLWIGRVFPIMKRFRSFQATA